MSTFDCVYTLVPSTFISIFAFLSVSVKSVSDESYPPVMLLTFTVTVPDFDSALFTVIVTVVPSSTFLPDSTFCFNTIPSVFELSSS